MPRLKTVETSFSAVKKFAMQDNVLPKKNKLKEKTNL